MRVAIDAQLARGSATGIGEYLAGLIPALRARADLEVVPLDTRAFDPWRFDRRVLWDQVLLPLAARRALQRSSGLPRLQRWSGCGRWRSLPLIGDPGPA